MQGRSETTLGLMLLPRKGLFSSRHGRHPQRPPCLVWRIGPTYFQLNFIAHAYTAHEAVKMMSVYWYVHGNFQENVALFCAISDF